MLERFLPRTEFSSYEDFKENYRLTIPENFNFGYDVVDAWAAQDPDKPALVWVNDAGDEKRFTFAEVKHWSDKAAAMFKGLGIAKGDCVMLMLKQRPEVWFCMIGLHTTGRTSALFKSVGCKLSAPIANTAGYYQKDAFNYSNKLSIRSSICSMVSPSRSTSCFSRKYSAAIKYAALSAAILVVISVVSLAYTSVILLFR